MPLPDDAAPLTLAALLRAQEELDQPNPDRPWVPQVGRGGYGLPYLPGLPPRAPSELRSGLSPTVDAFMGATGLPPSLGPTMDHYLSQRLPLGWSGVGSALDTAYSIGEAGPRQVQKAEQAIGGAIDDPSIGNIANAGTQTGMAALRPAIALPSLAVQYGDALARDLGFGDTSAHAQATLTRGQQRQMEIEKQRAARDAENRRLEGESASKLRREEADAASERELKAEAARKERDEYDRAVKRAEDFRETERSKQKTFKDTEVGKVWEKTGGTAPFLLGAISGFTQRGMNPNVSLGKVGGFGAVGGAAASNVPIGADAYLVPPVENPDKRAAEAYARELPPNHPRKKEWMDYAASPRLPDLNPARAEAKKELYDTEHYGLGALERNLFGAAEGAVGAELGYGAWHIPARGFNALGRLLRGPRGPQSADATPGVGGGGTPSPAGPPSLSPTAGDPGGVGRLQGTIVESGPSALGQGRLPAPEAVPNQQTLSQVLKQLDVANSNRAHHSRYQPRGQKDNPAQFKKGKPEFPPDEK